MYTLGNGKGWRYVERLDTKIANICYGHGVFRYGALHWMDKKGERVLIFDLTEEFSENLSPPHFPSASRWLHLPPSSTGPHYTMGFFGEDLCCTIRYNSQITGCTCLDIWLLKKKNYNPDVKEQVEHEPLCWSKECSLSEKKPLGYTKSGGVLCFDRRSFSIYDPVASTFKKLVDFDFIGETFHHMITLVSLKGLGEKKH